MFVQVESSEYGKRNIIFYNIKKYYIAFNAVHNIRLKMTLMLPRS